MTGRVLQVVSSTDRRGAEVFALDLEAALGRRGLDVRTVALAPGSVGGLPVETLGRRRLAWSTLRRLRAAGRDAAIVVAHGSTTLPACALALAGTGVPFIYRNIGDPLHWADTASRRARVRALLARAAAVVAVAPPAAAVLEARFGLPPERVTVIPTGAAAARFPVVDGDARRRARETFGLPARASVAVSVGALSAEKDVGLAIDAVAATADGHLLVAGDGSERAPLEKRARDQAPGRVHFTGVLHDPTVAYAAADVVLLTSRTEGLPAVLIEAGLQGLPAVATDVGYVREVIVDGQTGFVVPPGNRDAVVDAIGRARAEGTRLGAAARRHCVSRFELGEVAARWDALLASMAH